MTFIKSIRSKRGRVNHERILAFDGLNQHINCGNLPSNLPSDFSMVFTQYRTTSLSQNNKVVFGFRIDNNNNLSIRTGLSAGTAAFGFFARIAGVEVNMTSQPAKISNLNNEGFNKRFATVCFNIKQSTNTVECYINGYLEWSATDANLTGIGLSGANMWIGTFDGAQAFFQGYLSNIALIGKALTTDEIKSIHALGGVIVNSLHQHVLHHWPLTQKNYHNYESYAQSDPGDLIVNGDFASNDLTGWTNSVGTVDASTGEAVWQSGTTVQLQQSQWNNTNAGLVKVTVKYDITQTITGSGAYFRYEGQLNNHSPAQTAVGSYEYVYYTRGNITTVFKFINATGGAVDNLSVFVEKIPLVAWDVVEQYNYAKNKIGTNSPQSGDFQKPAWSGATEPIIRYGNDLDGDYVEFESVGTALNLVQYKTELTNTAGFARARVKLKLVTNPCEVVVRGGTQTVYDSANSAVDQILIYESNHNLNSLTIDFLFNSGTSSISAGAGRIIRVYEVENTGKLLPYHGKLMNFSDVEVGRSGDEDPATSIINTNSKHVSSHAFTRFNGSTSKVVIPHASNLTFGDGAGNNNSFSITAHFRFYANQSRIFEKGQEMSVTGRQYFLSIDNGGRLSFIIFAEGVNIITSGVLAQGKSYFAVATFDSSASNIQSGMKVRLYDDNGLIFEGALGSAPAQQTIVASNEPQLVGAGDGLKANADIRDVRIHSKALLISEDLKVRRGELSGYEISRWVLNGFDKQQSNGIVKDVIGANDGSFIDLISNISRNGYPKISKALQFSGSANHRLEQNTVNIDPNAEFYTFMVICSKPKGVTQYGPDFNDYMVYGYDGTVNNRFCLGGRDPLGFQFTVAEGGLSKAHIWVNKYANPDELQVYFITVDQDGASAGDSNAENLYINGGTEIVMSGSSNTAKLRFDLYNKIIFGNNIFGGTSASYDGYLIAYGLWNRLLSKKEMYRLANNLLFELPTGSLAEGLQQYNNFVQKTVNGIEDISGNGNHIDTFINYTASELDPQHSDYKFVDIDTLR